MNTLSRYQSIADAQAIVSHARCAAANVSHAVWNKLDRVGDYLNKAASEIAADLMNE